jgi:multidrug efflux pump subunit AcrA (membrane-fusion protein)
MNTEPISHRKLMAMMIITCFVIMLLVSCQMSVSKSTATVQRGDLIVSVTASGQLDRPQGAKANLCFATAGKVTKIYVTEGEKVKAGTLLAKLDDTAQKTAIAQAQYSVELAMNELYERIQPLILGYPNYYPPTSTLLRIEQAQEELTQAQQLMGQNDYVEALGELRVAQHDLEASRGLLQPPLGINVDQYPDIPRAIDLLEQDQGRVANVQVLMEQGNYVEAAAELTAARDKLQESYIVARGVCGLQIKSYAPPYPDASTTLDLLKQAEAELENTRSLTEQGNQGEAAAENLRMAQHDLEISLDILKNNERVFKNGLNLKVLRQNNLNLQKAEETLQSAKAELMKTEILAPFDGTVVAVGLKENDQLSAVDYNSRPAVYLENTTAVEMSGTIDEIDARKVKIGQEAVVTIDALPNEKIKGKVTYVSPSATSQSGAPNVSPLVINQSGAPIFPVTLSLEPTDGVDLQGGLTATADIIVEKHENVILIPSQAVKGSPSNYWVEVVGDEKTGAIEKNQVTLGAQGQDVQGNQVTEVVSGLDAGKKVVWETLHL